MSDLYQRVVGQERAIEHLRAGSRAPVHAYLLVGPTGVGTRAAAQSFAAHLLCRESGCGTCRDCTMALAERHPDLLVVEREGASIATAQIDEIIRLAARSPVEGSRKVLVLVDFHLVAQQYPRLLKTIEEPSATTVFVILAEHVPPELVTIASRCVRIEFGPVSAEAIADALVADGVDTERASEVAAASGGNIERARLLAADEGFAARLAAWGGVADRVDSTGSTAAALADELLATVDTVLEPLRARQAEAAAELDERIRVYGERASLRKDLDDKQKREQRRVRLDELRSGFTTLAGVYRDRLRLGAGDPSSHIAAIKALDSAAESLIRNPNETLLLQSLLLRLTA